MRPFLRCLPQKRTVRFGRMIPPRHRAAVVTLSMQIDAARLAADGFRRLAAQADRPEQKEKMLTSAAFHDAKAAELTRIERGPQASDGPLFQTP